MQQILLAEDDPRLAQLVKDYLEGQGFSVVVEANGLNISRRIESQCPDIVILDLMLPGKDGMRVCKDIRADYPGPILMLTARNSDADQIKGLECGADDYVIKPAEPQVLLARIRALLRRTQGNNNETEREIDLGALHIDSNSRSVVLDGAAIELSAYEFDLLWALARRAGDTLSRDFLFNSVYKRPWDGQDRAIDIHISHLRKKLGDDSQHPRKIKTVWGKGYMLAPNVWQ